MWSAVSYHVPSIVKDANSFLSPQVKFHLTIHNIDTTTSLLGCGYPKALALFKTLLNQINLESHD